MLNSNMGEKNRVTDRAIFLDFQKNYIDVTVIESFKYQLNYLLHEFLIEIANISANNNKDTLIF